MEALEKHNFFSLLQAAYRKRHSAYDHILVLQEIFTYFRNKSLDLGAAEGIWYFTYAFRILTARGLREHGGERISIILLTIFFEDTVFSKLSAHFSGGNVVFLDFFFWFILGISVKIKPVKTILVKNWPIY